MATHQREPNSFSHPLTNRTTDDSETAREEVLRHSSATGGGIKDRLAGYAEDRTLLESYASEFVRLGGQIAGHTAGAAERQRVFDGYFEKLEQTASRNGERTSERSSIALEETIEQMRLDVAASRAEQSRRRDAEERLRIREAIASEREQSRSATENRTTDTLERVVETLRPIFETKSEARDAAVALVREARAVGRGWEIKSHAAGSNGVHEQTYARHLGASPKYLEPTEISGNRKQSFAELLAQSVVRDLGTDRERTIEEARERLEQTTRRLHEDALTRRSSPEAIRAHLELASYNAERDDVRALYEAPEDRTRAEHADYLSKTSPLARDLYERGAGVYNEVLFIPSDTDRSAQDQGEVRMDSMAHAKEEFGKFIKDERALVEKAQEFVELGRAIAGRTADGNARLAVFRHYYAEVKRESVEHSFTQRDGSSTVFQEFGKWRSPEEQRAALDETLHRMRFTAKEMRELEWRRTSREFVQIEAWEQGLSARERDAESEHHGRLTSSIERDSPIDRAAEDRDETYTDIGTGGASRDEHIRVRLDAEPPRIRQNLTQKDERWLYWQKLPEIDRRLENGASPAEIARGLYSEQQSETARERELVIARRFGIETEDQAKEHSLTREEELRGLYAMRALLTEARERAGKHAGRAAPDGEGRSAHLEEAMARVDIRIEARRPTNAERAHALDDIADRIIATRQSELQRLDDFTAVERSIEHLKQERQAREARIRQTPEFQAAIKEFKQVQRDAKVDALQALIRANPSYPELIAGRKANERGETPFMEAQRLGEVEIKEARANLIERLQGSPEERKAEENKERELNDKATKHRNYYQAATGKIIVTSADARSEMTPYLQGLERVEKALTVERTRLGLPERESARRSGDAKEERTPIFISIADRHNTRLPIASFNEYQVATRAAGVDKLRARYDRSKASEGRVDAREVSVHVHKSLVMREAITGESPERAEMYGYLKGYAQFRYKDEATRMRSTNALYRSYAERLDRVRSLDELQRESNLLRRENYDREKHPESFKRAGESATEPLRPLTQAEMKKLFLAQSPPRYTDEMRSFRLGKAETSFERAERIKDLASGRLDPSPELKEVIGEMNRMKSPRQMRSFMAQIINPVNELPPKFNRVTPLDLHTLKQSLSQREKDYLFIAAKERTAQLGRTVDERARERVEQIKTERVKPAREKGRGETQKEGREAARDSFTQRAYTALATWREARGITKALQEREHPSRSTPSRAEDERVIDTTFKIKARHLDTTVTLMREFTPNLIEKTAREFSRSSSKEIRVVGEIVNASYEGRREIGEDRRARYALRTPDNSEISKQDWQTVAREMGSRLEQEDSRSSVKDRKLPPQVRDEIRRTAVRDAWSDITPNETRRFEKILDAPVVLLRDALRVEASTLKGRDLQARAALADKLMREQASAIANKVTSALVREQFVQTAQDRVHIERVVAARLNRSAGRNALGASERGERREDVNAGRMGQLVDNRIDATDLDRFKQLSDFAGRARTEYAKHFLHVDERTTELQRTREAVRTLEIERERQTSREHEQQLKESPSFTRYESVRTEFEKRELAAELRKLLVPQNEGEATERADLRREVVEGRHDGAGNARDLIAPERRQQIAQAAREEAWYSLVPDELKNTVERQDIKELEMIERAGRRLSEKIEAAQLIEACA